MWNGIICHKSMQNTVWKKIFKEVIKILIGIIREIWINEKFSEQKLLTSLNGLLSVL